MGLEERWTDIDKLLQPAPQSREELHERVVQEIAQARYEFPTPELASFRTFVNVPEVTLPVTTEAGNELTPKILAQVELAETITEERARQAWLPLAELPDAAFYLYVPVGYGGAAKGICKSLGIDVYGFRTWRYTPQGLELNDISEPPGIMTALMPPIVRKLLRGV